MNSVLFFFSTPFPPSHTLNYVSNCVDLLNCALLRMHIACNTLAEAAVVRVCVSMCVLVCDCVVGSPCSFVLSSDSVALSLYVRSLTLCSCHWVSVIVI